MKVSIAVALVVGSLVSYAAITPLVFANGSDTNTEQSMAQKNVGSGESTNFNCGENSIDASLVVCSRAEAEIEYCFVAVTIIEQEAGPDLIIRETFCYPTLDQCEEGARNEVDDDTFIEEPCHIEIASE
jgi:hypothetical protein